MEEVEHHTAEEVERALGRLRKPTLLKLEALARNWVRMSPQRGHEDLLSEALARILSGSRRWPLGLPLDTFLNNVMRSIAKQWADADDARPATGIDDAARIPSPGGVAELHFRDAAARMRRILALDPQAASSKEFWKAPPVPR